MKLAIVEDREEDKFEHSTVVKCWECDPQYGAELHGATTNSKVCPPVFYSARRP
jgi:ubiquitin carboxyl-terminal hydrolase 5/13